MSDQRLVFTFDGNATGLKKAMADVMAANRQMTDALTRKIGDIGAFRDAEQSLAKLNSALVEAKRRRDFFINSAASGGAAGAKLFGSDITAAKKEVLSLAAATQRQQSVLSTLGQSLKSAGIDTRNLAGAEAQLSGQMRSATTAMNSRMAGLAAQSKPALDQVKRSFDEVRQAGDRMRTAFRSFAGVFAAGFSVRGIAQAADEYAGLQARLKLASRSAEEFAASNEAIERIARATQAPLAETAKLYVRIASSLKDVDIGQSRFADTTEAMALALRVSGASAAESQSAMLQFSQAIASGLLRGEEFNAIAEAAPRLLQALAASLNKPVGALREMASAGQLTRDVLINGLAAELPTLRREAESLPKTLSGAMTELGNALLLTTGQIDQATGASASLAKSLVDLGSPAIRVVFQTLGVLGANVAFVFKTIGREIGAYAAQVAAMLKLDFKGARFIRDAVAADAKAARAELDALEQKIMGMGTAKPAIQPASGSVGATPAVAPPGKPDKKAIRTAETEAGALASALQKLDEARLQADADRLTLSLDARRQLLEERRKAELVDEASFIAAKAALDEQGLRNELDALQRQQAALQAVSGDRNEKRSVRTNADAELVAVEARIRSAQDKILNLNEAAAADIALLGANKTKAQLEFIAGLEQEARLSALGNEARETALLLIEAEKRGIADVNRLLELQATIRAHAATKQAADELKRQQDSLYGSVQQGVQRAFADGLNAVAAGGGGVLAALKNAVDTLRNAMSNAIAGSLTESFLGMLGGKQGVLNIAGSLGMGGKRGETPATPLFVSDVAAGGVLGGAAGEEGGGLFSGFFETIKGWFSQLTSELGSFFSGLMNSLSGLFSGGGGGGSDVVGWVRAIASLFGFGFAEGGFTGAGGKHQPAGVVHKGEYVFSQDAVRSIGLGSLDNLHRIASGSFMPRGPRWGYADGGLVDLPGGGGAGTTVNANTRIVNMFDLDSAMSEFMRTRSGERAILNIIQRNPGAVGA